jgi:fatty acid-binding protein DegV
MEIKIVSDSACNLPAELLRKYDITVLSLKSSEECARYFEHYASYYDAVIVVTSDSRISDGYQNAWLASKKYKNAYIVDSRNLSCGQGLMILEAAKMAHKGVFPEKICERLAYTANYFKSKLA